MISNASMVKIRNLIESREDKHVKLPFEQAEGLKKPLIAGSLGNKKEGDTRGITQSLSRLVSASKGCCDWLTFDLAFNSGVKSDLDKLGTIYALVFHGKWCWKNGFLKNIP